MYSFYNICLDDLIYQMLSLRAARAAPDFSQELSGAGVVIIRRKSSLVFIMLQSGKLDGQLAQRPQHSAKIFKLFNKKSKLQNFSCTFFLHHFLAQFFSIKKGDEKKVGY